MRHYSIAIDGPAGSGKSTVARKIAERLQITYLDTGAMYRAIAWLAGQQAVDVTDAVATAQLAELTEFHIRDQELLVNGVPIGSELRTRTVSQQASEVAKNPRVRQVLVHKQQEIASHHSIVMDGRDIGTVVLPDAEFKFYLTASIEERANRRQNELEQQGDIIDRKQLLREIRRRDENDQTRSASPLQQAADAILIDTTHQSIDEVVEQILAFCHKNGR